jgi:threonine aldolase
VWDDTVEDALLGKAPLEFRWELHAAPTEEMWTAMREASLDLGMASFGQDRTVRRLCSRAAELTGHEAAMFLPTVTTGISLAWSALDIAGTQVIMEERCHNYWAEQLHVSANAGAVPILVRGDKFGAMPLEAIEAAIKREYYHVPVRTSLVCLENTHNLLGGTCLSPAYTQSVADLAHEHGARLFLDGARVFNAAVAQNVEVSALTRPADAVVFALGKGLGAPMGGMLCGPRDLLERVDLLARRVGAVGIHKAGIMAAAALVGLETMIPRLAEDHAKARDLAGELSRLDGVKIDMETVQTNFVRVEIERYSAREFARQLLTYGLAVHVVEPSVLKLVVCHATTDEMLRRVVPIFEQTLSDLRAHDQEPRRPS